MPDGETPSAPEESAFRLQPNDAASPDSGSLLDASPAEGCAILLAQARQAFQENRRKECLVKTGVILSILPGHLEAQAIEQWIRADLQKEINDVRKHVLKAGSRPDVEALQRSERILRTIILTDPHNEPARLLLQEVLAAANSLSAAVPKSEIDVPPPVTEQPMVPPLGEAYRGYLVEGSNWRRLYIALILALVLPVSAFALWKYVSAPSTGTPAAVTSVTDSSLGMLEIVFTGGVQVFLNDQYRGTAPIKPLQLAPNLYHLRFEKDGVEVGREAVMVIAGATARNTIQEPAGKLVPIVVPASGVQLKLDGKVYQTVPESLDVSPGIHQLEFSTAGYSTVTMSVAAATGRRITVPVLMKPVTAVADSEPRSLPAPPPSPPLAVKPTSDVPPVITGTIRWNSSLVDVDIYENDRRLGSTPMTLDEPAGSHTFEYRHEGLKKSVSYNIQPGTTTTAIVTFEITVNINVSPFADVFMIGDSAEMELGQTPLNRVTVPVGGTLVFRYLNLPEKRYRVTAKDNNGGIHLSFP